MAGISSREIKNRIRIMQSTKAITKAMEMVAAAKLRRTQAQILSSRPYFDALRDAVNEIAGASKRFSSIYLTARPVKRSAWIVIAGDRGLAGGYNSNILKLACKKMESKEIVALPIGKKAVDFFSSRNCALLSEQYDQADELGAGDCFSIAKLLCRQYAAREFDEICIVYTNFDSVLSQTPAILQLLPLGWQETAVKQNQNDILYEPDCASVLDAIIPDYVGGSLYGALCECRAAEQAARRIAMDSATQNADEMIEALSVKYNRFRQAAVTNEIIDIVAGS